MSAWHEKIKSNWNTDSPLTQNLRYVTVLTSAEVTFRFSVPTQRGRGLGIKTHVHLAAHASVSQLHAGSNFQVTRSGQVRSSDLTLFRDASRASSVLFVRQGTQAVDPAIGNWQVAPPPGRADPILTTNRAVIYYKHCRPRDPLD